MLLRIMSDLHLEFDPYWMIPEMLDEKDQTLILAGDIVPLSILDQHDDFFYDVKRRFKNTIWIFGNHEHYGTDIMHQDNFINYITYKFGIRCAADFPYIDYNNKLVGCTFWTNYNNGNPIDMMNASVGMEDFRMIKCNDERLKTTDILDRHYNSRNSLQKLSSDIIITHHSPSYRGMSDKYLGSTLNASFHSDLDDLVIRLSPKLWIHGHTHESLDYKIGQTRIICNPKGYKNENKSFNPFLTVEVDVN